MNKNFSCELVNPSRDIWDTTYKQIWELECEVFGDKAFSSQMMEADLCDPSTTLAVIKNEQRNIIGFTYAMPETDGVARIVDTAITPQYQHKGLIGGLMHLLEQELIQRGYNFVTRDALIENGYAENILKHYDKNIVETYELDSPYGRQRHFKISLNSNV